MRFAGLPSSYFGIVLVIPQSKCAIRDNYFLYSFNIDLTQVWRLISYPIFYCTGSQIPEESYHASPQFPLCHAKCTQHFQHFLCFLRDLLASWLSSSEHVQFVSILRKIWRPNIYSISMLGKDYFSPQECHILYSVG